MWPFVQTPADGEISRIEATASSVPDRASSPPLTPEKSPNADPLIFLDIDGVICCNMRGILQQEKLAELQRICRTTGAKVVLSSDWRRTQRHKEQVKQTLRRIGVRYVGCTAQKTVYEDIGNWRYERPCRSLEITEWLHKFRNSLDACEWVAIDDRDLLKELGGEDLVGHFCHTTFAGSREEDGLTNAKADECIRILGGKLEAPSDSPCVRAYARTMHAGSRGSMW